MQKSDSIKELATALAKFQGMMKPVAKDASNPFFKSKYASLSAIIEDTKEPLVKCGLSYAQFPDEQDGLTTMLMHTSGEWISATYNISPVDRKPQSLGSAITYARRYALQSILGLQVDDDDGNEASKPKHKYDNTPIPDDAEAISSEDDYSDVVPFPNNHSKDVGIPLDPPATKKAPAKKATAPAKKAFGYVSFTEKKRIIKDLIDSLSLTDLTEKEEYETYVKDNTGLDLTAPNYDAIIARLQALVG